ncbi:SID1 transmembrane family member 1 [Eurytemora carolleeae]|uniref:SID1 transmembrane family member 1 n=1 Tax=Eurytemora carolleeae TaxID=1294199 RepID=UPI000C765DE0|nr:SID1 transmembrane family member 1 [Eurytemora carolleeae]|eukprot:XP_023340557.1 SID1 transmembrane family member 1-like [Eurytemora affinis]
MIFAIFTNRKIGQKCSNYNRNTTITPKKRVLIEIQENAKAETYTNATLTISSLYIGIMLTTLFFSFLEFKYKYSDFETIRGTLEEKIELYTHVGREKMHKISESIGRKISADHHNVQDGFHVTDAIKQTIEAVINPGSPIRKDAIISVEKEDLDKRVSLFIDDEVNFEEKEVINPGEKVEQKFEESEQKADENQEEELIVKKKIQFTYSKVATPVEMKGLLGTDEDVEERRRRRLDTDLKVSHLSMKLEDPLRSKSVYQKSNLYLGILLLISIFYSLPVLQMVFAFSHSQRITGNQDICYYNDLCRRPLGVIRDFNHVFSNLGYCVFGILFMLIVYLKKWKYTTFFQDNKTIQEVEYGVPQQYGIYFSMGLALFMEGVMSGSYHVCPTNITFQFDTTFMYLMCILMFLKLYQVRHADVSANAVGVFFGLGVSLILETVSIFYSGPWFWAFFCTVYMIVILVAMVHAYNLGVVKYDYKIFYNVAYILVIEVKKILSRSPGDPILPRIRSRLICLLVMGFVNICLCLYFGITGTPGASNYLLAIFILNLMMYFIYYCSMKIS